MVPNCRSFDKLSCDMQQDKILAFFNFKVTLDDSDVELLAGNFGASERIAVE